MSDVKLTDFTDKQLQHALDEVIAGILRLEKFQVVKDFIKYGKVVIEHMEDYKTKERYDNLCLWRTQILNAISTVQMREKITNS